MKKLAKETLIPLDFMKPVGFEVISTPVAMSYVVNIDEDFDHTNQFDDVVRVLESAGDNDYMRINLSSNGGALFAVLPLLGAMQMTQCHVHVHICSDASSAATFVVMLADSVSINDYVTMLFHNVSYGVGGSGGKVAANVKHTIKSSEKILRELYSDFFSEEEISLLLADKDYYLDTEEFLLRYEARENIRNERMEAEIAKRVEDTEKKVVKKKVAKPKSLTLDKANDMIAELLAKK